MQNHMVKKAKRTMVFNRLKSVLATKNSRILVFVLLFAVIGTSLLLFTKAATPSVSLEAESGSLTQPATKISDSGASSGQAVQFGDAGSGVWKPAVNSSYMIVLAHELNTSNASDMGTGVNNFSGSPAADPVIYDIDGFDNPASTVTALHNMGKKVVCYISAGSWELWRSDAGSFPDSVKGSDLSGWGGERWLDVRQISILGPIMQKRMDMCKSKGFDAVDFDNVDGYTNSTGFSLTGADQLAYNKYLAKEAHARGLAAALKNNEKQIPSLWQDFDFAVNEQCNQYNECDNYKKYFIDNNKAVFVLEYETQLSSFCPTMNSQNFNAYYMPLNLDGNRKPCR